jgi:DNA-binding beta-propeller fold protein YncE
MKVLLKLNRAALALCACVLAFSTPGRSDTITLTPRVIQVGKWAEGMAFDGSSLWVAESGQRSIAQINLAQGNVTRRVTVGRLPVNMTFANGTVYALVQTDRLIWQQFSNTGQGKALGGLAGCPQGMAAGNQYLWVLTWLPTGDCSSAASSVIRVDPRSGAQVSSGAIGDMSQAIAVSQGKVWVAHSRGQALSVIDEQSLSIQKANIQGASLQAITANGAQVYVGGTVGAGGSQGLVASVNPATLQEVRRQVVDQPIAFMADDDRNVVAVGNKGKIYIFSTSGLELQRTIELPTIRFTPEAGAGPRSVMIQGDNLYISNGQQFGENGAILILSGWRPAAIPVPSPPTPQPAAPPPANVTDCPYQVANVGDATGIWMYQDPDTGAPRVMAVPSDSRGLVADQCIANWCHMTFRGASGWVQRNHIQAYCN